jgi:hypothetical protein
MGPYRAPRYEPATAAIRSHWVALGADGVLLPNSVAKLGDEIGAFFSWLFQNLFHP